MRVYHKTKKKKNCINKKNIKIFKKGHMEMPYNLEVEVVENEK